MQRARSENGRSAYRQASFMWFGTSVGCASASWTTREGALSCTLTNSKTLLRLDWTLTPNKNATRQKGHQRIAHIINGIDHTDSTCERVVVAVTPTVRA